MTPQEVLTQTQGSSAGGNASEHSIKRRYPTKRETRLLIPKWLDERGRECWRQTVRDLKGMDLLRTIDVAALAAYCDAWSRWREACAFLDQNGLTYVVREKGSAGTPGPVRFWAPFPQVAIAETLLTQIMRFQMEFGLTPAARLRLKVGQRPSSDSFKGS